MPSLTYAKPSQAARPQTKTTPKPAKKNIVSSSFSARTVTGRWTKDEHLSFQNGIARFGWGNWRKISTVILTRTATQTKSHAQKWEKRIKLVNRAISGQKYKMLPRRRLHKSTKKSPRGTKKATKSAAKPGPKAIKCTMARPSTRGAAVPAAKAEGRWTDQEKAQFARAIVLHGWSAWSALAAHIPTRTTSQIKSHAQKYMKLHVDEAKKLVAAHEARRAEKAGVQQKQKQKKKRTKKASRRK